MGNATLKLIMVTTEKTKHVLTRTQLREIWPELTLEEQIRKFKKLSALEAAHFFADLQTRDQARIILTLPIKERRLWLRALDPDDAADIIQATKEEEDRQALLNMLDQSTRNEVIALLTYAQDVAGGLMNPRYIQVKPELRVDEAISYIRRRAREQEQVETIHYIYVLDREQHLLGIVSMRELFQAAPQQKVKDIMHTQIITVAENLDQEEISVLFSKYALLALPVVDHQGRMMGVVTVDDIVDVVQKEATEDIQKMGGTAALAAPYLQIGVLEMVKKRVGWLTVLFVGEMFTASTMQFYEKEIARAVVLALFLPLIISSGGNAGSQACTLVIRALSLGEVRIRDCLRVLTRECVVGTILGVVLALIGLMRVLFWPMASKVYGQYFVLIAVAVALSIIGVVLWGALIGSFLPFVLKKAGLDPAAASAPFVATFVDVTGLIIYFSVASCILHGTLL